MNPKKIFGHLFIIVTVILTLAIIVLLPQFMKALLAVFNNHSGSYQIGYSVGYIVFSIIHIIITFILWKTGIRWTKKHQLN